MAQEKVLIIDDSDALRSLLKSILPYAGYQVLSASTGGQGLKLASEAQPDVILTDLELPDMSGLKVLEELNQRGTAVPTIMMTGYGSEGIAARALQLGVRDYLIKPFTTEEVLSSIERALSESRLKRENEYLAMLVDNHQRCLRIISAIGRAAISGLDLDTFLQRVAEAGRFATEAEVGLVLLLDGTSEQLHVAAAHGQALSNKDERFLCQKGSPSLQAVFSQDAPIRVYSPQSTVQLQTGDRVKAVVQVPLRTKTKTYGLLSVDRRIKCETFEKQDELLLSILADYASMALEKAQRSAADDEPSPQNESLEVEP